MIPFLKRTGFLGSDGAPTERYRRFRNDAERGAATAEALRAGYAPLYEVNEYIHDAGDAALKGVVVQVTGAEPNSSVVKAIIGSFKALKAFATGGATTDVADQQLKAATEPTERPRTLDNGGGTGARDRVEGGIKLGYTINLNLPATSEIAVFDAIFKSLREHLL